MRYFTHLIFEKDLKKNFSVKKLISTSKQRAEHPSAGGNTQHLDLNNILKTLINIPFEIFFAGRASVKVMQSYAGLHRYLNLAKSSSGYSTLGNTTLVTCSIHMDFLQR